MGKCLANDLHSHVERILLSAALTFDSTCCSLKNSISRDHPLKGTDVERFTVSVKRYPDTNHKFSNQIKLAQFAKA